MLVVLWVTVVLTVMVNTFIAMVRTEARSISNYKQETEAYYLARSGIHFAIQKLLQDEQPLLEEEEDAERWIRDGRPYTISLMKGFVTVRVMDEGGKLDVNRSQRSDLLRGLLTLGVTGVEKDTIADSILDWRDENNFHRLNGAEDDYYRSLMTPYGSKDGPLDTVDELLWVRGVTPEIFFGDNLASEEMVGPGMTDLFTIYNDSVRVNINTAPMGVLLSLPGMEEETARMIFSQREGEGKGAQIQSMGDFSALGGKRSSGMSKYIRFDSPGIYSIETTGWLEESPAKHSIKAVVKIKENGQFETLYWKDQCCVGRRVA